MANTFKSDTKSSVVTDAVSSTNTNIVTAGGSATLVLLSILISNKTGASAQVDVFLVTGNDDTYLLRNAPVPAGSSLEVISGSKIIMESFWLTSLTGISKTCPVSGQIGKKGL